MSRFSTRQAATGNTSAPPSLRSHPRSTNNSGKPPPRGASFSPKPPSLYSSRPPNSPPSIRPHCFSRARQQVSKRVLDSRHLHRRSSHFGPCRRVWRRSSGRRGCMLGMLLRMGALIRRLGRVCSLMGMRRRG